MDEARRKIRVTCPRCGCQLLTSAGPPPLVTCPRCLQLIDRSKAQDDAAPKESNARPISVVPLEQQTSGDLRKSEGAMAALIVVLSVGILIVVCFVRAATAALALLFVLVLAAFVFVVAMVSKSKTRTKALEPASFETAPPAAESEVLNYYPALSGHRDRHISPHQDGPSGRMAGMFVIGFVVGVGIAMLALVMGSGAIYIGLPLLASTLLCFSGSVRAFGGGLLLAFGLSIMIVVVTCGGVISEVGRMR